MKKTKILTILICTIFNFSFGQTLERIAERRGEYGNYQYGFINDKGDTIVPIKYDFATKFVEGFSIVNVGCEWGVTFEEKAGQVIEKNVCLDGKWGYINYQGEEVIPLVFDKAYYFQENFALVHIGGTGGAAWSGSLEYVDSVAAARRINHGFSSPLK